MNDTASVKEPVLTRTVCEKCGHLHRAALRKKCACCAVDVANVNQDLGIDL